MASESEIRTMLEDYLRALNARDADGMAAHIAPDVVAFDCMTQVRLTGAAAYRRQWEPCLEACPPTMTFSMHDVTVTAGEDVAFSHHLHRCGGTMPNGEKREYWTRMTVGHVKTAGKWRMTHIHLSSPYDLASGQALVTLGPEHGGT